jgi:pyruvate kinase
MKINFPTKRTKILCTIGPSSWEEPVMRKLIENGMNVARINGAFGDVAEMERVAKLVRSISDDVALLIDIKGHEVRLNKFAEAINIKPGDEIVLGHDESDPIYPITYTDLYKDIEPGQLLYIDKGEVSMTVTKIENQKIYCKILSGNIIKPGKGMNIPGSKLKNSPITKRDIEQIAFACKDNWDYVAGSFIRNKQDVITIRESMTNPNLQFIAKIEDQQGIDNFDEILEYSDGIMIARGDLGSEIPIEKLPYVQKQMIIACNKAAKPVITATNMLESMIEKPFPTRAEVTDVANAVLDGTDAIMTSGETSFGKFPAETIELMSKICVENEKYLEAKIIPVVNFDDKQVAVAISNAAFELIKGLKIDYVVTLSKNDTMPRLLSRFALDCPVIALVKNGNVKRQLNMCKGITAFEFDKSYEDRDEAVNAIKKHLLDAEIVHKDAKVLIIGKYQATGDKKTNYPNIFEFVQI